ncbi:MAG: NADH-quinone oxidoreductase subunit M [Bacteroidota bacterium]|nr:NADH-quinone oxidoreductase subunit M [Bacteroidota bacterium]
MKLALVLALLPFLSGMLLVFLKSEKLKYVALTISLCTLFYFLYILISFQADQGIQYACQFEWIPGFKSSFHIGVDSGSIIPLLLTQIVIPLSILLAFFNTRTSSYYGLILMTQGALNAFFCAQNPITFYVFFELALIPIYFVVLLWGGENRKAAVFKFFIYTVFGSFLLLASILAFNFFTGSQLLNTWSDLYGLETPLQIQHLLLISFFITFGIKAPIFPFHTWQVNLYEQADRPTVIIIAAVLSKMGAFGLYRFSGSVNESLSILGPYLMGICIVGILYGALIAWKQNIIPRLLAYSSLSHMSLIMMGVLSYNVKSMQGAMYQILIHGLSAAGLFVVADVLIRRTLNSNINASEGMAKVNQKIAIYFFIILLSSIGLPLTAGFIGEFFLLSGITEYNMWMGILAGTSIILGAVYMLLFYQRSMFGNSSAVTEHPVVLDIKEESIFIILIVLVFVFGLFPQSWLAISDFAISQFPNVSNSK